MNLEDRPLVSVIMPIYNAEAYLAEAVDSILEQTYSNFELLLVDDGSTDNSKNISEQYVKKDKRVRLIQMEKNGGISAAMNRSLKEARGIFVARADADDINLPDRLKKEVKFLNSHPDIAIVGCDFCYFTNSKPCGDQQHYLDTAIQDGVPPLNNPTCLFRKELFDTLGYYDPKFDDAEDTELWLRWYAQGARFTNIQECLYHKRIHSGSVSVSRIRHQVSLMLRLNMRALFVYRIRFSRKGYAQLLDQIMHLTYLTIVPKVIQNKRSGL